MTYNPGDPYVSPYLGNPYDDSAEGRASVFPYSYSTLESAAKQVVLRAPHMADHGQEYVCRTQQTFGDPPNILSITEYFSTTNADDIIISLDDVLGAINITANSAVPDFMPYTPAYYAILATAEVSARRYYKSTQNPCIYEWPEPHVSDTELNSPGDSFPVHLTASLTMDGVPLKVLDAFPSGVYVGATPVEADTSLDIMGSPSIETSTGWGSAIGIDYPTDEHPSESETVFFDLFHSDDDRPYQTNRRCVVNPHPSYPYIPDSFGNIFGKCLFTRAQLLGKSIKAAVSSLEGGPMFLELANDPDAPYNFHPPYFSLNVKLIPFAHFSPTPIPPEPEAAITATPGGIIRLGR